MPDRKSKPIQDLLPVAGDKPRVKLPKTLVEIPNFPKYKICSATFLVWRVTPPKRGPFAGRPHVVKPQLPERSKVHRVFLWDADGVQHNVAMWRIVESVFGEIKESPYQRPVDPSLETASDAQPADW